MPDKKQKYILNASTIFAVGIFVYSMIYAYNLEPDLPQEIVVEQPQEVEYIIVEDISEPVVAEVDLSERELIDQYISEISDLYNFDKAIVHSVVYHESRYKPDAKNGKCLGLMQVSTKWHSERANTLGVEDFYDPYGNILLGVDYLSELYNRYGDMGLTLMMYNMGHTEALRLYNEGKLSWYANSVLERAEQIRLGVIQ